MNLPAPSKFHLSLDVTDLDASARFYGQMFESEPTKRRVDYVQFDLDAPAVVFTLNQATEARLSHLGVRVASAEAVDRAQRRLAASGLATAPENGVECCYAVQDKVWVSDPSGHAWEVYTVNGAADAMHESTPAPASTAACCPTESDGTCCSP